MKINKIKTHTKAVITNNYRRPWPSSPSQVSQWWLCFWCYCCCCSSTATAGDRPLPLLLDLLCNMISLNGSTSRLLRSLKRLIIVWRYSWSSCAISSAVLLNAMSSGEVSNRSIPSTDDDDKPKKNPFSSVRCYFFLWLVFFVMFFFYCNVSTISSFITARPAATKLFRVLLSPGTLII